MRLCFVILVSCTIIVVAFRTEGKHASDMPKYEVNFTLAKTISELKALRKNSAANIIRTIRDFDAEVVSKNTPFKKIPREDFDDFRNGISERAGKGIVSLKFDRIQRRLSADDFAEAMAMFGLDIKNGYWGFSKEPRIIQQLSGDMTITKDGKLRGPNFFNAYENYYCDPNLHACVAKAGYICLSTDIC
ncbi:hypothetical protein Q4E93_17020 [Flavitalea sp. BT771]|uniref:hypothetical protein n=1 Tax=Flavitalea sp. BT771 TaxID=3063329 RepID=UPI0026E2813D|nr:hypothetical protein [Flavitalea sp. BT771]MDO6432307.1 hypothetical protein [Flavitalea sp. BT771]MDV6221217.1 hypothetical protein [Flavitalea sp. BT771]